MSHFANLIFEMFEQKNLLKRSFDFFQNVLSIRVYHCRYRNHCFEKKHLS